MTKLVDLYTRPGNKVKISTWEMERCLVRVPYAREIVKTLAGTRTGGYNACPEPGDKVKMPVWEMEREIKTPDRYPERQVKCPRPERYIK